MHYVSWNACTNAQSGWAHEPAAACRCLACETCWRRDGLSSVHIDVSHLLTRFDPKA